MKSLALITALFLTGCSSLSYDLVQSEAQRNHVYISDQEQYGQLDYWAASLTGDCEDYALWIRERVGGNLVMVKTKSKEFHMVLKVGDYVFDNMSRDVYKFEDMPHKFLVIYPDDNPSLIAFKKPL